VVTNRAGQGGQGKHPPTGLAGSPQQQPVDLWPHLDQSDGCVRGESAQRLGFGREAKKNSAVSRTHARMHARLCIEFVILLIEEKVMSYVTVSKGHGYPLVSMKCVRIGTLKIG
jgi:hypothetical protein